MANDTSPIDRSPALFGRVRGPIVVDLFAGGGGASLGIEQALGVAPIVAINHDECAIEMHRVNHPHTEHYHASVFDVAPLQATRGRYVDLLWASPDCTHHSRARGGKPRERGRRALAWVVVDWARDVRPRVIALENVPEWVEWGPLGDDDMPVKARAGEHFLEWVQALEGLGYVVEWRFIVAASLDVPTIRKRLFLVARCDGMPIRWPLATNGGSTGVPLREAAECIQWELPIPSIFGRRRELADATQARIAEGVRRYVLTSARPFLLNLSHGGRLEPLDEPMRTVTAGPVGGDRALVAATLINTRNGERRGQRPRAMDIRSPMPTVTAAGSQGAVVAAFLNKHYGGVVGHELTRPLGAITGTDHHSLAAVWLDKLHGSARAGVPITDPMPAVTSGGGRGGGHAALCAAFLMRYFGTGGQWSDLRKPMPTVTAREGIAIVTTRIDDQEYVVDDIGMRMLQPRELARAQGFPDSYVLTGNKGQQIERIGNSVCPPVARAIVEANLGEFAEMAAK